MHGRHVLAGLLLGAVAGVVAHKLGTHERGWIVLLYALADFWAVAIVRRRHHWEERSASAFLFALFLAWAYGPHRPWPSASAWPEPPPTTSCSWSSSTVGPSPLRKGRSRANVRGPPPRAQCRAMPSDPMLVLRGHPVSARAVVGAHVLGLAVALLACVAG